MKKTPKIKWKGEDYILIGGEDGAIATPKEYENFELSTAHLFPDGFIRQFGKVVGKKEDIIFTGEFYED